MKFFPEHLSNSFKVHLVLAGLINAIFIGRLVLIVWNGNDKAIVVLLFYYSSLLLLNAFIWFIFYLFKLEHFFIYKIMTIALAILFIPTVLVSCLF
jgi:hypothetical protein